MTVREIINLKLPSSVDNPAITIMAIEETGTAIKSYCNISQIPNELDFTWANMAVDLIKYQLTTTNTEDTLENIGVDEVSQVKIGDTTISLGKGSAVNQTAMAKSSHLPSLDELVMNYKEQLRKFRRMVW